VKQTDQREVDVKVLHQQPALIQELTWWPPVIPENSHRAKAIEQIVFSFNNGELYKISVTYDRSAVEGFTAEDMVNALTVRYGNPMKPLAAADVPVVDRFDFKPKALASWEDSDTIVNLVHASYTEGFGLVIFSKHQNILAEASITEAVKLEGSERPQKEADQRKKQASDLEIARQKNKKTFQP
jgi:hypothetical protein